MSGTVQGQGGCNNGSFGFGDISFGTKYMSDLMRTEAPWAKGILDADRLPVKNSRLLNANNRNSNTYGALVLGLAVQPQAWQAADATVKATLNQWVKNLNTVFTAHQKYAPENLAQWATDLRAAADCLTGQSATLAQRAEISIQDHAFFTNVSVGLRSLADNLLELQKAVKAEPAICEVNLDFAIQQH